MATALARCGAERPHREGAIKAPLPAGTPPRLPRSEMTHAQRSRSALRLRRAGLNLGIERLELRAHLGGGPRGVAGGFGGTAGQGSGTSNLSVKILHLGILRCAGRFPLWAHGLDSG